MLSASADRVGRVWRGKGNDALRRQILVDGLQGRVFLLGQRTDVAELDIATSSSSLEVFPNAIGEAMSCAVYGHECGRC